MKTRIIHTRFWQDSFVCELNYKEKLVFVYLLTNDRVSLTGIYELPDKYIRADLDLTNAELQRIKQKLHSANRILFKDGWIKIVNHDKYNSYKGESIEKAKERELSSVPSSFTVSGVGVHPSVYPSVDPLNNHKSKIINNKYNNKYGSLKNLKESDFKEIAAKYQVPVSFVLSKLDDMKNWMSAKGKRYKNYKAALMNWVKEDAIKIKKEGSYDHKRRGIDATKFIKN